MVQSRALLVARLTIGLFDSRPSKAVGRVVLRFVVAGVWKLSVGVAGIYRACCNFVYLVCVQDEATSPRIQLHTLRLPLSAGVEGCWGVWSNVCNLKTDRTGQLSSSRRDLR